MKWPMFPVLGWRQQLPRDAAAISVEWPITEGGICAYAWTDKNGQAFVALKTLNRIGKATGLPDWLRRRSFKSDMVVGFIEGKPLVITARVKATIEGLELTVRMPREVKSARDFVEKRFAAWGSGAPTFSFMLGSTVEPYAAHAFPTF
jgi:hypothetical protein